MDNKKLITGGVIGLIVVALLSWNASAYYNETRQAREMVGVLKADVAKLTAENTALTKEVAQLHEQVEQLKQFRPGWRPGVPIGNPIGSPPGGVGATADGQSK